MKLKEMTGIDQPNYSKIQQSKRTPTHEQLITLAKAFVTRSDYILGLTNVKETCPARLF